MQPAFVDVLRVFVRGGNCPSFIVLSLFLLDIHGSPDLFRLRALRVREPPRHVTSSGRFRTPRTTHSGGVQPHAVPPGQAPAPATIWARNFPSTRQHARFVRVAARSWDDAYLAGNCAGTARVTGR